MDSPALARRQIVLLTIGQALLYINNVTLISVNGLAGLALAPTPLAATLPVTCYIIGAALTTMPASLAMGRYGRRAGFMFGATMGMLGTATASAGVLAGSFVLLCAGTFITGVYNAFWQYLRFAAVDVAEAYHREARERAIAWVLAGGIAGGIVGPELSKLTRTMLPTVFAGTYVVLTAVAMVGVLLSSRLRIPHVHAKVAGPARPLRAVMAQPAFVVALAVGAISYGAMNLLMTATPLAMKVCGFGYPDAADVIKWHVIAMFGPGFFTGALVRRFGAPPLMLTGCVLMLGTLMVAHSGLSYWHFWTALVLLGVGWNFMFVGATTLLTTTYTAAEKARVQGVNDLVIFLTMMTSSAASGALVSTSGWLDLNLYAAPAVGAAMLLLLWLLLKQRSLTVAA